MNSLELVLMIEEVEFNLSHIEGTEETRELIRQVLLQVEQE